MLAASIIAPSAMERADSFSRWGFPDSSSSTTCGAAGEEGAATGGVPAVCPPHPPRYISVLLQRDLPVVVRVVHVEEDWQGQDGGGRVRPPPSHRPAAAPRSRPSLTFEFLLPEAIQLLLVHVHLDGSEVGHDGQEVLEVYLIRQPRRLLPQVPAESGAAGDRQSREPLAPSLPKSFGSRRPWCCSATISCCSELAPAFPQDSASISIISSLAPSQPSGTGALQPALSVPHAGAGPSPSRGAGDALTACQKRHGRFWP